MHSSSIKPFLIQIGKLPFLPWYIFHSEIILSFRMLFVSVQINVTYLEISNVCVRWLGQHLEWITECYWYMLTVALKWGILRSLLLYRRFVEDEYFGWQWLSDSPDFKLPIKIYVRGVIIYEIINTQWMHSLWLSICKTTHKWIQHL